ncbi:extracellular solute-binding protein [Cohnella sp. GCM10027633]|uniref:extracellular solute-binding protein n=1 Tax=unclassified Cohnella TaxID=2636738 RepID=UPI003637D55F
MKVRKWMVYSALLAAVALAYVVRDIGGRESFPVVGAAGLDVGTKDEDGLSYYADVEKAYAEQGISLYEGAPVELEPTAYSDASEDADIRVSADAEAGGDVLEWSNGAGWVEWTADVPADGLYELEISYRPTEENSSSSVFYSLSIDGAVPYSEAKNLEFLKRWRDKDVPYRKDSLGNETRSMQVENAGWKTDRLSNYGISSVPLRFYLSQGKHALRFAARNESMTWGTIRLAAPVDVPAYERYSNLNGEFVDDADASWYALVEGERYDQKSHPSVQTGSQNEPHVSPDGKGRMLYNILDGQRWKNAGEWAEWSIEVPADGLYEIDVKYYQSFVGKAKVFRSVLIDGETPFRELLDYPFVYNGKLEIHTLGTAFGEPFLFRLSKGKHTIRLVADTSPLYPVFLSLQGATQKLYDIEQKLRKLTGDYGTNTGDLNRTWDMKAYDPDLEANLTEIKAQMQLSMEYLDGLNQSKTDGTQALKVGIVILGELLKDVDQVPNKLGKFSDLRMRIGSWMDKLLKNGGLSVDFIVVREPNAKTPFKEATTANKISYTLLNFARTFTLNYNERDLNDKDAVVVWVGRGRDYASLLQEMIDQEFTPRTGIKVNVNFMPDASALTLSNAGGDQPDVALGLPQDVPVDYAMREASTDLSQFSDFKVTAERFHPGVMRSFAYDGGVYALPETQSYPLLFYRKSILKSLGLTVPDTWDDLRKLLPTLQENGMYFYYSSKQESGTSYNPKNFAPFFYQNGAEFYTSDGLKPAFNSEQGYAAFSQWTELFGKYDLPMEVEAFFQNFKLGTMPLGISDFNTYIQLLNAAPEIRGDWGIAPMPGTMQADGTVARWAMSTMTAGMILDKSDKQEQAWRFLEWWTSADVQLQYGNAMESFYGPEYRWNTANMKAMASMPWPAADIAAIKEQNRWDRNVPLLPGGYFLAREMEFAWNRSVVQNVPPKDSLDRAYVAVEREMARKREELGIADDRKPAFATVEHPFDWEEALR